ncbi:MAG: MiaB/RimO family radical SAM methylthiotransferase, partial [Candidatus Margulisiibacteriota bacterium]
PKNLTDTEVLMGKLVASGYEITNDPAQADIIIVNTCAFLKSAREEALDTIREMAQWKKKGKCKKLYIAGCLPKWFQKVPPSPSGRGIQGEGIDGYLDSISLFDADAPRLKTTPPWYAYVKIAEGCNNRCSYCLIPKIRGPLKLRPVPDIIKEVKLLARRGVKEIIYIAQDTTAHPKLPDLLRKTTKITGVRWIRLMYAHPEHVTDKLIEVMAHEKKVIKYLDLPIQHSSDKILKLMGRSALSGQQLENLILKIRRRIPNIALRTSVIVGFPGEGEAEFAELVSFLKRVKFQKMGAFAYSREKGTPAGQMRGQVPEREKGKRLAKVMRVQARISRELNRKMIGKTLEILMESPNFGRSYLDAPEIDGTVFVKSNQPLKPGEIVNVRITQARTYDLVGFRT